MKREVSRKKVLPAFSITVGDLDALWTRLAALFEKPEDVYARLDVDQPSEKLEFKSIEDLKQYPRVRGRLTKFSLWLSQGDRRVVVDSSTLLRSRREVRATAESEAWCAGAIETAYSFLQSNRLWYAWFLTAPIGWLLLVLLYTPTLAYLVMPKGQLLSKAVFLAWLGVTLTFSLLYFAKARLLPGGILVVTQEDSFLRRHTSEITLVVAILSLLLTVVGWFLAK